MILNNGSNKILLEHASSIQSTLNEIKETVQTLVEMYTKTFRVNFSFEKAGLMEQSGKVSQYNKARLRFPYIHNGVDIALPPLLLS